MINALIIDDSDKARESLKRDIQQLCPTVDIIGEANSVVGGLKALKTLKPELLFLDIHLGDGTGFDILELSGDLNFKVIFTTASDAHAIQAFKFSAIDYLLKPIDIEELVKAVKKVDNANPLHKDTLDILKDHLDQKESKTGKIALHTSEKIHICEVSEIIRCEADVNYTLFKIKNESDILVTKTLKHFDQLLTPSGFCRVHQSHLINLNQVKEFVKADGGYLVMTNGDRVPVSGRRRAEVIEHITNVGK